MVLARILLSVVLVLALAGCGTKTVRKPVVQEGGIEVILRGQTKGGVPVDRGFQHPAAISGVRLSHLLSRIDIRTEDEKASDRSPAIHAEILYDVGDALSKGLSLADSSQEIVVMAKRRTRHLGVFTEDFLTSFVAYVKGDRLYIYLSRIDWPIPKNSSDPIPEPKIDKPAMKFHVLPSEAMQAVSTQGVAADWRDPIFQQPTAVRITATGKVVRRTILMESAPDQPAGPTPEAGDENIVGGNLSPETLRKLADLEEARRRGELTEGEYSARKRSILLADPSSSPAPPGDAPAAPSAPPAH
ncbi:MAG TPA: SHOCT domain-containing protein [Myxococcota bacterium]|nr:SHOCT domain-containing protein [Myxococcota bacterium]